MLAHREEILSVRVAAGQPILRAAPAGGKPTELQTDLCTSHLACLDYVIFSISLFYRLHCIFCFTSQI